LVSLLSIESIRIAYVLTGNRGFKRDFYVRVVMHMVPCFFILEHATSEDSLAALVEIAVSGFTVVVPQYCLFFM
jgi:hypothetical protein